MLKLLGCIMILAASTGIGFVYSEKFKKRSRQLEEIERCIYQLQNEIVYTHAPLPQAIEDVSRKSMYPINEVFKEISYLLFENKVDNVHEAFRNALNKRKDILNLKRDDINILLDFSKTLGESDIEGQQKIFHLTLENLKKRIKDSEILMSKNVKMYRYLGFSLGALIVIILV